MNKTRARQNGRHSRWGNRGWSRNRSLETLLLFTNECSPFLELSPGHKPEENTFPIHLMSVSQAQNIFIYVGIFRQLVYISQINTVIFKTHLVAAAQRQSLAKGSLWPCCVVKKL